jgi:hypothetical protein
MVVVPSKRLDRLQQFSPGDPQSILAAGEAAVGLLTEISFIATFIQRFFGR